jgi:predicted alpha/beta-hydrolase family hydrolase
MTHHRRSSGGDDVREHGLVDSRVTITCWDIEREPAGRALVLPGAGYTVDHPLLFWACHVLADAGWQVTLARWEIDAAARAEADAFVERAAEALDAAAPPAARTLVVAKSFGTFAARWACARSLPGVWLTPVLPEATVVDALTSSSAPGLLVGGTADELWLGEVAVATGKQVLEVPGADHALHVEGDWRASVQALRLTLEAIESFAAGV